MIRRALFLCIASLSVAATANAPSARFVLRDMDAVVYSDDGEAKFRAGLNFIRTIANNPDDAVRGWDPDMRLVRIDAAAADGLWLSCRDLMPIDGMCTERDAESATSSGRGSGTRGNGSRPSALNAVPMCPSDPRCPVFDK